MKQVLDWSKAHQRYFEEMTRIPHGSYHEKQYSDYLAEFARSHGLRYKQYDIGNVIIYKEASKGYEDHPAVVIQAHMDMVCEKTPESSHDFEKDPLKLYIEDGWLCADGTTLGADDGTGVSYMLAILEDNTLAHPALECVFTAMEEIGLDGALALGPEDIKGRRYINLDGGGGGVETVTTAAGGLRWNGSMNLHREAAKAAAYRLIVGGLEGGHSGGCIHLEKGNAIKLCGRILKELQKEGSLVLSAVDGGSKDNAIPRDCWAEFVTDMDEDVLREKIRIFAGLLRDELRYSDSGLTVVLEKVQVPETWSREESDRLVDFLFICPTGLRHRNMNIKDHTIASENLAVVKTSGCQVKISVSMRSAFESFIEEMAQELRILGNLYGFDQEEAGRYPAWGYEEKSSLREAMRAAVKRCTGTELVEKAVHGGLECGVAKNKWPDMDIITMGPTAEAVHSPDERLDLQSFDNCYKVLCDLLENL